MARMTITNRAAADWQAIIEDRVSLMLGSALVNIRRIDIDFDSHEQGDDQCRTHSFCIVLTEASGAQVCLRNEQVDANDAIEGGLARARRVVVRRKWTRLSRQRLSSA